MTEGLIAQATWAMLKPEYLADPVAFMLRRLRRRDRAFVTIRGGLEIEVLPDEMISNSLRRKGHYELATSEVIWRLLDPGETALDVGGHIGYLTALMATRVGAPGRVVTLEPHPDLFPILRSNAERWTRISRIQVFNLAAGDVPGPSRLRVPRGWEHNRGASTLAPGVDRRHDGERELTVSCERLDDLLDRLDIRQVGLMKVDVEGFEAAVFRGASKLLREHRCRDVVFEDFGDHPTDAMRFLGDAGYSLFAIAKGFRAPWLSAPDRSEINPRNDRNFLATRDPLRAASRMERRGYNLLAR